MSKSQLKDSKNLSKYTLLINKSNNYISSEHKFLKCINAEKSIIKSNRNMYKKAKMKMENCKLNYLILIFLKNFIFYLNNSYILIIKFLTHF